ncbi:hypothetical protein [Sinomonas sp. B1-1]|uniref:hypothetical protein n=1 Tax=Sinomonas sp. B1-1 TaxID=3141454 RepID=UPI003D29F6AB
MNNQENARFLSTHYQGLSSDRVSWRSGAGAAALWRISGSDLGPAGVGYVNPNEDQSDGLIRDQSGVLCQ